jgi:putative ATP-dependent DNA ligase
MDPNILHQTLQLAQESGHVCATQLGRWDYLRFSRKFRFIPEGTVVFGGNIIWSYPKIGRILRLDTGIQAQFASPFWAEEKIDGYNVRLFRHGDDVLALTRRGYICPFTTDRLHDLLDRQVLQEQPELVLCAEVAGPENPYNEGSPPSIVEDVQLFVFDVMRRNRPDFLPHREKLQVLETYGLPGVPQFGRYRTTDLESLNELVLKLDREGREGLVLKEDSPRNRRIKYVTGRSNLSDIQVSEGSIQQLPPEYFLHRILRLALFIEEHGIAPTPAVYQELGKSLLSGTLDAIRQYQEQHKVCHTYRCRFRERANAELLLHSLEHLLGKGQVRLRRLEQEGEFYRLEFAKVLPRPTGLLGHVLGGGMVFD